MLRAEEQDVLLCPKPMHFLRMQVCVVSLGVGGGPLTDNVTSLQILWVQHYSCTNEISLPNLALFGLHHGCALESPHKFPLDLTELP